ncbi:MAG: endolytic transglycosylase MltG [Patescibacteria group bacterium]
MRLFKVSALVLFGVIGALAILMTVLLSAKDKDDGVAKELVVVSGMTRADIAKQLSEDSLIKSQFAFFLYLKMIQANVLPGTYEISSSDSASAIADNLARAKFKTAKITIIEGWRVEDIETYLLDEKKLTGTAGFAAKAAVFEGYLFPDTYEVQIEITADELIELMRENFIERTSELAVTPETINLASIIEREAKSDGERAAIAGVYVNRLEIGMNLQADATVQYAKGNWKSVSVADYTAVISPYNTYLNAGLPPGPICNPGLASIRAVLEPEDHDYFYYFHAKGETIFSKTAAEHSAKVRQYF